MTPPKIKLLLMAWFTCVCLVDVATAQVLKVIETDDVIVVRREARDIVTYNKVSPPAPRGIDAVNDFGSDRVKGNHRHAKWVALTGSLDGKPATIAVLSHADNFRAPQAARLHPTKPCFCFAPCVDGTFTIDRKHPFKARYRYLVKDAEPDAKWIDQQ